MLNRLEYVWGNLPTLFLVKRCDHIWYFIQRRRQEYTQKKIVGKRNKHARNDVKITCGHNKIIAKVFATFRIGNVTTQKRDSREMRI